MLKKSFARRGAGFNTGQRGGGDDEAALGAARMGGRGV